MQILGPADKQPDKATLLARLASPLKGLVREDIDADVEAERILSVAVALRNLLLWRGKQHLKLDSRSDGSITYTPIGTPLPGENNDQTTFNYVFNVLRADGKKYSAVIGQRAPHVKAVPEDPENETHNQQAREADAVFRHLKTRWQADRRQKEIARHLWRTGPVFVYTPYVADGEKYGYTEQPKIEIVPTKAGPDQYQCPNCGAQTPGNPPQPDALPQTCQQCSNPLPPESFREAEMVNQPQQVGTEKFPNGAVELHLATILDVVIPTHAKGIEECEYLNYEYDEHVAKLIKLYATPANDASPEEKDRCEKLREKLRSDNATDAGSSAAKALAADAKEMIQSNIAMRNTRKNMARFSRYWIRPFMFELVKDADVRAALYGNYPEGLKISMVAGEVVDLENEKMDDVWAVHKTASDEKILSDPACADLVPIQNILNNFYNMAVETILRGIPKTIVDSQLLDRKSLEESDPNIAEVIFAKSNGGDFTKQIAQLPVARMSDQMVPIANLMREMSREIDGVMESIFGGGGASNETWRAAEMRKNQALMQLGPDYDEVQRGWERTYENGTRQLARFGSGTIKVQSESGDMSDVVNLAALAEDGWHAEANEQIPMSYAEERDSVLNLITQSPDTAIKLRLFEDENRERMNQVLGIRGFKDSRLDEIRATQKVIKDLLQSPPIKTTDPMTGQEKTQPSIPPNDFADDHILRSQFVRMWLNSPAGQKEYAQNREGWENVQAYGVAQGILGAPPELPPPDQPKGPSGPPPQDTNIPSPNESPVQPKPNALQQTEDNQPLAIQ